MIKRILNISYTIALIILLSYHVFGQTIWYVDNEATGANNGTSWADAWETFNGIVEASLDPGDIVYISGGTDSTVYTERVNLTGIHGTAANHISIRNSYESGHNGRVILDGNNRTLLTGFHIDYSSYVYIKGIEIREFNGINTDPGGGINLRRGSNVITFDSILVYDNNGRQIFMNSTDVTPADDCADCIDSVTIKNSYIVTPIIGDGETDCISVQGATNTFLDNNYIRQRQNGDWDNQGHADPLQAYRTRGWTITNNYFICDENTRAINIILGAVHLTASSQADNIVIYNNYMVAGGTNERPLDDDISGGVTDLTVLLLRYYAQAGSEYPPTYIMNNTIISAGSNYMCFQQEYPYTYATNNIFAQFGDGVREYHGTLLESSTSGVCQVDSFLRNLIHREWGDPSWYGSWYGNGTTGNPTASNWFTTYGATGAIDNPDFELDLFPFDSSSLANYTMDDWKAGVTPSINGILTDSSVAIDAGVDIQERVESFGLVWEDILGNPRDATPDVGAFQYSEATSDSNATVTFTSVSNAALNSYHIAYGVLTGADTTFWVLSSPDSFDINYPYIFDVQADTAHVGDTVAVPCVASGINATSVTKTIKVSGVNRTFTVTTIALADTVPDSFSFIDYGYADLSTAYTSFPFMLENFDSCNAYFGGSNFEIYRSGSWGSASAIQRKVYDTDSIRLNLTSSGSYSTTVNDDFTAGGVIDNWKITTKGDGQGIDTLVITDVQGETQEANHPPLKTIDNLLLADDADSRWAATPTPKSLVFDLDTLQTIVKQATSFYNWDAARIYQYSVDISNDNSTFYNIIPQSSSAGTEWTTDSLDFGYEARYVRINHISNNQSTWAGEYETELLGIGASATLTDTVPTIYFVDLDSADFYVTYTTSGVFANADSTFWVTINQDSFKIGALGTWTTGYDSAEAGDTCYIALRSGLDYSETKTATLTAGGSPFEWSITTIANAPIIASGTILKGNNGKILRDSTGKVIKGTQ